MYGNFKMKADVEEEKAAKLAKLNRMKKIYLPPRLSPSKFMHIQFKLQNCSSKGKFEWTGSKAKVANKHHKFPSRH